MVKIAAQENRRRYVLAHFTAFKMSGELEPLRVEGLAVLKRTRLLSSQEWWETFGERTSSKEYLAWHEECKATGERFGLASWTVEMACLLEGFDPKRAGVVLESKWPEIRVVTEVDDPAFLARLAHEAQKLGVYVVYRQGSVETTHLYMVLEEPPLPATMPPRNSAFEMRLTTPIDFPPEAARQLQKIADDLKKELLKQLGYHVRKRIRSSPLVSAAEILRADEKPLPSRGIPDIVDDIWGEDDSGLDQERQKLTKSRRNNVQKRLDALRDQQANR